MLQKECVSDIHVYVSLRDGTGSIGLIRAAALFANELLS